MAKAPRAPWNSRSNTHAFLPTGSITSTPTPPPPTSAILSRRARSKKSSAITPTKSMTGHMLGGAGGVEMAACALAIRDSIIPPTINLENPSEECDLDYTANVAREKKVRVALNNSFGFGGHNATLVATAFTG